MLPVSNRDGQMLDMLDAMFTATSATCVTGLVVFDTYTPVSYTHLPALFVWPGHSTAAGPSP